MIAIVGFPPFAHIDLFTRIDIFHVNILIQIPIDVVRLRPDNLAVASCEP